MCVCARRYFETVRNHSTHISVRITDHLKSQAVAEGSECTFAEADNVLSRVAYVTPSQQWSIDIAQVKHGHPCTHVAVFLCRSSFVHASRNTFTHTHAHTHTHTHTHTHPYTHPLIRRHAADSVQ